MHAVSSNGSNKLLTIEPEGLTKEIVNMARATRSRVGRVTRKRQEVGARALGFVRKHFPNVKHVMDAKKDLIIEVTPRDLNTAKRKNHEECAMAVACKRSESLDGVIMALSTAYA